MRIAEIMTPEVELAAPGMSVREAASRMRDDHVGALPVGENDRLVGMITDRDIAMRCVAEGADPASATVRDAMSERVYWCFEEEDDARAAELMAEHQVHRLPVLNADKRLVGMVALADLARGGSGAVHRAVEGVSKNTGQTRS